MVVKKYSSINKIKKRYPVKLSNKTMEKLKEIQEETGKTYDSIIFEGICENTDTFLKDMIMEEYNLFLEKIYNRTTADQRRNFEHLRVLIRSLTLKQDFKKSLEDLIKNLG